MRKYSSDMQRMYMMLGDSPPRPMRRARETLRRIRFDQMHFKPCIRVIRVQSVTSQLAPGR